MRPSARGGVLAGMLIAAALLACSPLGGEHSLSKAELPTRAPASAPKRPVAGEIILCQAFGQAPPCSPHYVDCAAGPCGPMPWQTFGPGEYAGHSRTAHVPEYRLRVDDQLDFAYRLTREETSQPYRLSVGDEIRVESITTPAELRHDLVVVQPDGTITLRQLNQVRASGLTLDELRLRLNELYRPFYNRPEITVSPLRLNIKLEDLRATVDSRFGTGGQNRSARVTPDGTIALPAVGSVFVQGLTLDEVKRELDARYAMEVQGIEVTPVLVQRAPRSIYVLGEVRIPGRFPMDGPTTMMQALAMAGSWNIGANLRQVVVFRRGDDWRLMATMVDIRDPLYGEKACPAGEIWLNDSDVIIVPKSKILQVNEFIDQVFTRGVYGVVPFSGVGISMAKASTL